MHKQNFVMTSITYFRSIVHNLQIEIQKEIYTSDPFLFQINFVLFNFLFKEFKRSCDTLDWNNGY